MPFEHSFARAGLQVPQPVCSRKGEHASKQHRQAGPRQVNSKTLRSARSAGGSNKTHDRPKRRGSKREEEGMDRIDRPGALAPS